jgi:hypothetical protein
MAVLVLVEIVLRWWAQARIVKVQTDAASLINGQWTETRKAYVEVLATFIKSVVLALERYGESAGVNELSAFCGEGIPTPVRWVDEQLGALASRIATEKMTVYPPAFQTGSHKRNALRRLRHWLGKHAWGNRTPPASGERSS